MASEDRFDRARTVSLEEERDDLEIELRAAKNRATELEEGINELLGIFEEMSQSDKFTQKDSMEQALRRLHEMVGRPWTYVNTTN